LVREVSDLKQQMERLARSLARCGGGMTAVASDPDLSTAFASLTEAELDPDLTYEIISGLGPQFSARALHDGLSKLDRVRPEWGRPGSNRRIATLVGPPGAGKTSALVKLAIQQGIAARKQVQFLSLDTYRIAAAEELQSYAAILGVGCKVLE